MLPKKKEVWVPLPGHEGAYEVSDMGRVRSLDRKGLEGSDGRKYSVKGRVLKPSVNAQGVSRVNLPRRGRLEYYAVPDLVLEAFVRPRRMKESGRGAEVVHHKNGDKQDNRLENLEWKKRPGYRPLQDKCKRGHRFFTENNEKWAERAGVHSCVACARGRQQARRLGDVSEGNVRWLADREYLRLVEVHDNTDLR